MPPARYELQDLLTLREKREDKRLQELDAARKQLSEAERLLSEAEERLSAFRATKPDKVNALYAAVMRQVVSRGRLEQLKVAVAELDAEELALAHQVDQLREARDAAQTQVAQAHAAYVAATKNVAKLDMHKESWKEEVAKEEERDADLELEDFIPRRRADDDDSSD